MGLKSKEQLAPRPRLPSLRAIMQAQKCSRNAARTFQAMYECAADEACFRTTGLHFMKGYTDLDLMWKDLAR